MSKYKAWYDSIISYAKNSNRDKKNGIFEKHHIIPRSLGGNDEFENTILLTPKEHFICHLLLVKLTSGLDRSKMAKAVWMMKQRSSKTNFTSRLYEQIRIEAAEYQSDLSTKMWKEEEIREYLISKKVGRKNSTETKMKMSEAAKKRHREKPLSESSINAMKEKLTGRNLNSDHIEAIRKGSLGIKKPGTSEKLKNVPKEKIECPHCGKIGGKPVMVRYHFDNCKGK